MNITFYEMNLPAEYHIVTGWILIVFSFLAFFPNLIFIRMVIIRKHLNALIAFRFMMVLSLINIIAIISIFISGIFTLQQGFWFWTFNKIITALGLPCYPCYCVTSAILSLHCLMLFSWPNINARIFSNQAFKFWILFVVCVYAFFGFGFYFTGVYFHPEIMYWDYDDNETSATILSHIQESAEDTMIILSGIIYILFMLSLIKMRNKAFSQTKNYIREVRVFVQTLTITFYSLIFNILWYHSDIFLPRTPIVLATVNFLWLINHSIDPIVYFIVNRAIKSKVKFAGQTSSSFKIKNLFTISYGKKPKTNVVKPVGANGLRANQVTVKVATSSTRITMQQNF